MSPATGAQAPADARRDAGGRRGGRRRHRASGCRRDSCGLAETARVASLPRGAQRRPVRAVLQRAARDRRSAAAARARAVGRAHAGAALPLAGVVPGRGACRHPDGPIRLVASCSPGVRARRRRAPQQRSPAGTCGPAVPAGARSRRPHADRGGSHARRVSIPSTARPTGSAPSCCRSGSSSTSGATPPSTGQRAARAARLARAAERPQPAPRSPCACSSESVAGRVEAVRSPSVVVRGPGRGRREQGAGQGDSGDQRYRDDGHAQHAGPVGRH